MSTIPCLWIAASARWSRTLLVVALATACLQSAAIAVARGEEAGETNRRILESVKYLASDELEGRGVGTKGLDKAADYLAEQFAAIGLNTKLYHGGPFQTFMMSTGAKLGENNSLAFVGPSKASRDERLVLELGKQFNPLAIGGSKQFDLPLVFVGYGITDKHTGYDDYAGIDVKDKAVVILRHHPGQKDPHSSLAAHAPFKRKVSNAYEHGAGAVIFCSDGYDLERNTAQYRARWQITVDQLSDENAKFKQIAEPSQELKRVHEETVEKLTAGVKRYAEQLEAASDPILAFDGAGAESDGRNIPVLYCSRRAVEQLIESALHSKLSTLEVAIDQGPTPSSRELAGWRAVGKTDIVRQQAEAKNVVGVLEGQGPHAEEAIVVGAHYDHLGWGDASSAAPGVHEIHNGADDNGSGTTALLEVARLLAARSTKLPRKIVFVAFTGEERGLIGSARYVRQPLVPLDDTIAMLNMDMVGRLRDDKLIVHGTGTATEFDALVDRLGKENAFQITRKPGGFGPSDHSSFYAKQIPVLFFFTGSHSDYHRPSDDYDKINTDGMRRISRLVADAAVALATSGSRPHYQEIKDTTTLGGGGDRPYFGSIPDFSQEQPGYALNGVSKDSPADRGGLRGGDVIVQLGDSRIGGLEDFDSALRKYTAGDKVPVVVRRGKETLTLEVTLDPPRR